MFATRLRAVTLTTYLLGAVASSCGCTPATPEGPAAPATKLTPPPTPSSSTTAPAAAPADDGVSFSLLVDTNKLYPAGWMPPPYAKDYPSLSATIKHFTEQSLLRDGITGATVTVKSITEKLTIVTIKGGDPTAVANYGKMLPKFFDHQHAFQALAGVTNCQSATGCWCTDAQGCQTGTSTPEPWALFLPLGLPMVNQKAVLLLDYPPSVSLTFQNPDGSYGDYLQNWTMCRWNNLMTNAGAPSAALYESIVDSRPIAAAGSKLTKQLPPATQYFNSPNNFYITPMLDLLANPPSNPSQTNNLPITALGGPPRQALGDMVNNGTTVAVLQAGKSKLSSSSARATPWIGNNHPDVTTYQCCAGDTSCGTDTPTNQCLTISSKNNHDLLACETVDFTVACFLQAMGQNPDADVNTVKSQCAARWSYPQNAPADARAFCIQAKLDNNNKNAQCQTYAAAEAYCAATTPANNPCFSLTCDPPTGKPAPGAKPAAPKPAAPKPAAAASDAGAPPKSYTPLTCSQMPQPPTAK